MDFFDNSERMPARSYTWASKINTELHGSNLKSLCRRTQRNLDNLSQLISHGDPCLKYGIKHWHPDVRPTTARDIGQTNVRCNDKSIMFTSVDEMENLTKEEEDTSDSDSPAIPTNKFCYLCTTLEEHERHLLLNRKLKRPSSANARIEYVAPKPSVKKKIVEREENYAKENLYKVDIYTGDIENAGTDAKVYITIKGSRDILPKTLLKKGRGSSKFTFLRNTKETFYIKGPKLGNLEIVTIEHDGLEKKHGWYLDKIEITEIRFNQTWIFLCNQWLSMHIRDYQIKRDLIGKEREAPVAEYLIKVITGTKRLAGTDAKIYLTLYGKYGTSKKIHLIDKSKKMFERGSTDNFRIQHKDLGDLQKIRIEHDGKGIAPGWFLDRIIISNVDDSKNTFYFVYNGWIAKDVGDGLLWREIRAKKNLPKEVLHGTKTKFIVTVQTGDVRYAGTDANVYIQITGSKGITEKIQLDDAKNNFEKGMVDEFQIELFDVGKIEKINIGHDNSGPGAGWFLEWVKIRRQIPKHEVLEHLKQMKQKMAVLKKRKKRKNDCESSDHTGDNTKILQTKFEEKLVRKERDYFDNGSNTDEILETLKQSMRKKKKNRLKADNGKSDDDDDEDDDDDDDKIGRQRKHHAKKYRDENEISMRVPLYEEYEFICKKWLAEDEGDGLTERELAVSNKVTYYKD